ncbi:S-adenosyl-L-methionine-dependent methyltransferase [Aspergillus californicus]
MSSTETPLTQDPLALIAELSRTTSRLGSQEDTEARKECLRLSRALTAELEQPENIAVDMAFSPMIAISTRTAVDLNLFKHIVQSGPITSKILAELTGAEELLIVRILRVLSATHFVQESGPKTWTATRITKAMATDEIAAGHRMISKLIVPAMQSAPDYLVERDYSCPTDPRDGLVQYALKTEQTIFEIIGSAPALLMDFHMFMGNTTGARRYWIDYYPVQNRILDGASPETALIVDVGAGKGHDLLAYNDKFPNTGRLVLQDLQTVTGGLKNQLDPGIEVVAYDFFTEQPVTGARVYFYHHILHDWADSYCLEILERVAAAMTPGYSKLLLHEMIVPEQGASQFQAQLDLTMMAFNGGLERTREQWTALLEKAGLMFVGFWDPIDEGGDGIVEAMKV